jgi:predicted flap endonuclease-1-like 5' DNA nuclease
VAWFLGQSFLFLALSFLLGVLVGWLIWGRLRVVRTSTTAAAVAAPAVAAPAAAVQSQSEADVEPESAAEPERALEQGPEPEREIYREPEPEPELEPALASATDDEPALDPVADVRSAWASEVDPDPEPDPEPVTASLADVEPTPELVADIEEALEPVTEAESAFEPVADRDTPVEPVADREALVEPVEEPEMVPVAVSSTVDDDLERIEGIGPKMAAALRAAGIHTFAELADADVTTLEQAIEDAGLRFAPSLSTWSRQARLLADGDEDGFAELVDRLVAGRDVSAAAPVWEDESESEAEPEAELDAEPEPVAAAEPEPVAAVEPEPVAAVEPEPVVAPAPEPVAAAEPEPVVAPEPDDDLKRIEGIGPQMSAALQRAGIRTFRQLAGTDDDTLRNAIEAAGLRFAPSLVTWARQARLLAEGDEAGFADLTRRLVAGRDVGRV